MSAASELAESLKGRPSGRGWMARCVAHEDSAPSLSISEGDGGKVLLHCFAGCSQAAVIAVLRERSLWPETTSVGGRGPSVGNPLPATARALHWQAGNPHLTTLSEFGRFLWDECRPIDGVGAEYIAGRGGVTPPRDGDLRWHSSLRHPSGYVGPALVGLITDSVTGEPLSLHRTWIQADGTKALVDPPRLLLKGHRKAGGVIRLWPDDAVTRGLAIGEGVETCLAAAHSMTPVWCLLDAGNLAAFPVLPGIESLTIFADADDAGMKAAVACAQRWAAHAEVVTITPRQAGADIADLVST